MTTAFQPSAFQTNAFQSSVDAVATITGVGAVFVVHAPTTELGDRIMLTGVSASFGVGDVSPHVHDAVQPVGCRGTFSVGHIYAHSAAVHAGGSSRSPSLDYEHYTGDDRDRVDDIHLTITTSYVDTEITRTHVIRLGNPHIHPEVTTLSVVEHVFQIGIEVIESDIRVGISGITVNL